MLISACQTGGPPGFDFPISGNAAAAAHQAAEVNIPTQPGILNVKMAFGN